MGYMADGSGGPLAEFTPGHREVGTRSAGETDNL